MAEDIATERELLSTVSSNATLSPSAIASLLLEIQTSLLETPEHAHLSDAAEDLLFGLVRSMKNAEALGVAGMAHPANLAAGASSKGEKPRLRIVPNA